MKWLHGKGPSWDERCCSFAHESETSMTRRTLFYAMVVGFSTAFYAGHIGLLTALPMDTSSLEDVLRPLLMWVTGGFVLGTAVALSLSGPARRHPGEAILGAGIAMAVINCAVALYCAGHGMSKSYVILIVVGSFLLVATFGFAAVKVSRSQEE